jgi:hypothetical protein
MKPLGVRFKKKIICIQTFAYCTMVNMQTLSIANHASMLGINPITVEE